MVPRIKISIPYSYNQNWIGGTYYIQNLISAINVLDDGLKPELLIDTSSDNDYNDLVLLTKYPYISKFDNHKTPSIISRVINKIGRLFLKGNLVDSRRLKDVISFPGYDESSKRFNQKSIFWIADFQDKHLPYFFSDEELDSRLALHKRLIKRGVYIVFSSQDARNDFNKFYPQNGLKQFVLRFAVTHPVITQDLQKRTLEKFDITSQYFICSNQFWVHKNHITLLKAIAIAAKSNPNIKIVLTGKNYDHRNPNLFAELEELIRDCQIEKNVVFLGFIDRIDQISLMKSAVAVIQPSLFEGWSTVIEDAKAQNCHIIASDLQVHREQLANYKKNNLFEAKNENSLADVITHFKHIDDEYNYQNDVKLFGEEFCRIIQSVHTNNPKTSTTA